MKKIDNVVIPSKKCICGYRMDRSTCVSVDEKRMLPQKGDFSVCISCGELYVFKDDLTQRRATVKENEMFSKMPGAETIIKIRKLYKEKQHEQSTV